VAAQQAGATAAQGQAASALAGATAAIANAVQAARLTSLLQQLTQPTAIPAPTAVPLPPVSVAQGSCAAVVGGLCAIAGQGFFGQCTKIGSMSCMVTVSIGGAGLTGEAAASPVVVLTTTQGAERITCTPPLPGAPTISVIPRSAIPIATAERRVIDSRSASQASSARARRERGGAISAPSRSRPSPPTSRTRSMARA
jgi:hypothetical protein